MSSDPVNQLRDYELSVENAFKYCLCIHGHLTLTLTLCNFKVGKWVLSCWNYVLQLLPFSGSTLQTFFRSNPSVLLQTYY